VVEQVNVKKSSKKAPFGTCKAKDFETEAKCLIVDKETRKDSET
jgi:hypothetical protein